MKKIVCVLFILLLFGCSNDMEQKERIKILEKETYVAYSDSQNVLAPRVCLENHKEAKSNEPFLVTFEVTGELKSIVEKDSNVTIDSRNLLKGSKEDISSLPPDGKSFCTGITLPLTKEVAQDELENMITQEDLKVSVTELDGEVISSYTIKQFVIGKPDGSIVEP
ncbi:hypothetical protein [Rossellomorea vietnamensis]|uniref:Lipoprotein n=1 Tax=Rossellomorea vietnamensis TaxID=218284 RepID=A0A0P6WJW8_9BACI|nr:hypothetical protein [Rossellomorea vietnamensis]KPL60992.1 hypothetical protein AM506_04510 [Rossellomorea vietnamensis]